MVMCCFTSEVIVALSGTLDTFALPDVLRLLASTAKTGRLRVTGSGGSGSVWLDGGGVNLAEMVGDPMADSTRAEVLFGLLRLETGSFTFEDDMTTESDSPTEKMDVVLAAAESMLAEWREIETVVPSMDVWVGMCAELAGPDVMVDADRWRGIAAVGSGSAVVDVAHRLELHEVEVCRMVKELIELGLVERIEPADNAAPAVIDGPISVDEDESMDEGAVDGCFEMSEDSHSELFGLVDDEPCGFEPLEFIDDAAPENLGEDPALDPLLSAGDPLSEMGHVENEPVHGELFAGATSGDTADEQTLNPAEMARQLANLSPRAAKAVAEAARATTDAERDAALAAVEAEDETVNRSLLLKFLGSVDS